MNYRLKSLILTPFTLLYSINPKVSLQLLFYLKQGYKLNLKNPTTYNEKINWQKLYYHNDEMSNCSDKYLVRDYIEKRGYAHTLNELLWEGFNPNEIPYEQLPEKFVMKVTHGSGFNIICTDKKKLDRDAVAATLKKWLKTKYIKCYGESWYGRKAPRIVIEKYIDPGKGERLFDYKFFCFNGVPKFVYVDTWRGGGTPYKHV